ncbi:U3 snoRNP protein, IMP4 (nucleomorph) [Chroomonas mesostigmatica CCMP1168]|uniref:U3 snoRNP protein, IMP4 n=1 Tax=Chroomonas mesostigmatica CCMP1168 TaxID=1195612 RepID=J7G5P3_9CRYP|nr:U3 snoRNP protein, IMP4 [Chroomonas mesostigmatica CCMP1168]
MKDIFPLIFVTTSRFPSLNLLKFTKEIRYIFPNSKFLNRGSFFIKRLITTCLYNQGTDLIMIHEHRGNPDAFVISHLPKGPSAFFCIKKFLFSFDIKKKGFFHQSPNLIVDNLESPLGKRLSNILCSLFCPPQRNSKRIITFSGKENHILVRHHLFQKNQINNKNINLIEIGPSLDLYPYKITLGVLGENSPLIEWNLPIFTKKLKKIFLT